LWNFTKRSNIGEGELVPKKPEFWNKLRYKEIAMPVIRPVADLETNPKEVLRDAYETRKPVFLTKNGYGNAVILSMEAWEDMNYENEIYQKLLESSIEARTNPKRLTEEEVYEPILAQIAEYETAHPNAKD
jgi:prevent-host-death family protein